MKTKSKIEKHLFVSDFQIPEQDDRAIAAVLKFIPDFKPHVIHFVGDILDLTKQSKFDQDPYDKHTFNDEIQEARGILKQFVKIGRGANKDIRFNFFEGNHERRAITRLSRAMDLADLSIDDEYVLSLPHLLQLKALGIKWVPYYQHHVEKGHIVVEHGDIARSKAGFSAHAMLDRRGMSGVSGHTHRLALVFRTQGDSERFWIENGCLCRKSMRNPYMKKPDWIQGFSVGVVVDGIMHPSVIPMLNHTFVYGDKIYRG